MRAPADSLARLGWLEKLFSADRRRGLLDHLALILALARQQARRMAPALLAAVALSGLALVPAALLAMLVDRAFADRSQAAVVGIAGLLAAIALADAAIAFGRRVFAARAAIDIKRDLANAAFAAAIRLPIDRREARDHGVLGRSFEEIERIAQMASEGLLEIALGLGTALVLATAMLMVDWRLGTAVIALLLVLAAIHVVAARHLRQREQTWLFARNAYWSHLIESIAYGLTIRLTPAHRFAEQRFAERLNADLSAQFGVTRLSSGLDAAGRLIGGLVIALIALLGGLQVIGGVISLGEFVLFLTVAGSMSAPVLSLAKAADDLQAMAVSAEQVGRLACRPHEPISVNDASVSPGRGAVTIDAVSFDYDETARPVLAGLALSIAPGEKVALLGESGSGKSTLASLLAALRAPLSGAITLDGVPLARLPLGELRRRVALVPHEIDTFTATIAENIAIAEPDADRARVERAAAVAAIDADIRAIRGGYDATLGGQGGVELSAGQRQRLGIARAVLARPELLILDESTSALDLETEARVLDNLMKELPDTTLLAITHRHSVAQRMQRCFKLANGAVDAG
jgi:ABC-type bacteriocin/lantibiotic exporter with double-glycine peptidase domain